MRSFFKILTLSNSILVCVSCMKVTTTLQTADVEGPGAAPTARIAKRDTSSKTTIRPYYGFAIDKKLKINTGTHTKVNSEGVFELIAVEDENYYLPGSDNVYDYEGRNLSWKIPQSIFGFDIEISQKHKIYLAGFNVSQVGNKIRFGGILGIGLYSTNGINGVRANMEVSLRPIWHKTQLIVKEERSFSRTNEVFFVPEDVDAGHYINFYLSLAFNTYFTKGVTTGWFGQLGLGSHELVNVDLDYHSSFSLDGEENRADYSNFYSNIVLGVFKDLSDNTRIIGGYRFNFHKHRIDKYIRRDDLIIQLEIDFNHDSI